jgi:bacteriocin biosynthesis cyclodehydratase domain-containing protein
VLKRPRFRPHFHVEIVPGEGVFLLSDTRHSLLRGRLYELIAPWMDGRTADDLSRQLKAEASPAEIFYALTQLEKKGYLCEDEPSLPVEHASLWSSLQIAPNIAVQQLAKRPIVVRAFGVDAHPFLELLKSLHVQLANEGPADVVLTDSAMRQELRSCNAESLRDGRPWLLVKPTGREVWVGPLFHHGKTACWECLAERLQSNLPIAAYLLEKNGHTSHILPDRSATPATLQIGLGLAANAVASWIIRGEAGELEGKVQTLDVPTWRLQSHTLKKLPFCKACGVHEKRTFQPPTVTQSRKTFTSDGGHRVVSPEETLSRYMDHVSPITGAVSLLERATPASDDVLHVYFAGNNRARPSRTLGQLRHDLRSLNAGKGTSDVQARASALCEGLERYSGVFRGDEPRQPARQVDLGEAAISLNNCLLFSERQYRERAVRNSDDSRFSFVPVPFDPKMEVEWSPVWSLTRSEVRYLPTSFCYYNYPQPEEQTYCLACSNGCAAGNSLEEAILQGFLELVERDSVALWWYNRIGMPGVDLDSFEEPYLARLRAFLHKHGCEFWVLDLTADLGIPVFASITRNTEGTPEQIVPGFGAHLDPKIALLRAVTEMNQMLSSPILSRSKKGADQAPMDPETAHWLKTATTANQPYLLPREGSFRTCGSYPRNCTDDLAQDVRMCQALVERAGMEMLILDQTRPEIGLPVVKVIVPGLRHFWARFGPGRLYDVPVRIGWLPRPLAEEELNPIPMFL